MKYTEIRLPWHKDITVLHKQPTDLCLQDYPYSTLLYFKENS